MPRRLPIGGESRLSLEGLSGEVIDGKTVKAIYPHGAKRRTRTVVFTDGSTRDMSISDLVDRLIKAKGGD